MSTGPRYDTKLIAHQAVSELPLQVLMYELYGKLPQTTSAYVAMGLIGLGSTIVSDKAGEALYRALQEPSAEPGEDYFVSKRAEWTYNHLVAHSQTQPPQRALELKKRADHVLAQAPAYTETYHRVRWGLFAAKCTAGAMMTYSRTGSLLGAVLYGLTQPLAVIVKDSERDRVRS
jgi:hypothetical protein